MSPAKPGPCIWASFRHEHRASAVRAPVCTGYWTWPGCHSISLALYVLPLGTERGYTGKAALAAADEVWWAAVLRTMGSQETTQLLGPCGTCQVSVLCNSVLPLVPSKGNHLFWITNQFFTLFTYCVCLQMNSESLASACNWTFCEVQSAADRDCFVLWKKPPTLPSYTIEMWVVVSQIWQPLLWHMLCITYY